jgi:hypothetical protein
MPIHRLLGAYRGIVLNNTDPLQLNRLQVIVPDLTAMQPAWAVPLTLEGGVSGIELPTVQSAVSIEFEEGNIHYPAWINLNPGVPRLAGSLNRAPIRWLLTGEHYSRMRRTHQPTPNLFDRL